MDPFILYGYLSSIAFYIGLFNVFLFVSYVRRDQLLSMNTLRSLNRIKFSAILFSILIAIAGIYIRIYHHKDDDPAGFLALCSIVIISSISIAIAATIFIRRLEKKLAIGTGKENLNN
ncbi:DUF2975 domain-containing protein [Robertkochia solimangrovi]|uniref:DUF2975 domain-containing protein n=1 Tax=Robertkochia solimangrovi TaxID=2213046 RepID=UPI003BB162A7